LNVAESGAPGNPADAGKMDGGRLPRRNRAVPPCGIRERLPGRATALLPRRSAPGNRSVAAATSRLCWCVQCRRIAGMETPNWKQQPHRRYNPLTREWVLVSPQRTERPWQGQVERRPEAAQPPYEPSCYLCPGNERAGGARNPATCILIRVLQSAPVCLLGRAGAGRTFGR